MNVEENTMTRKTVTLALEWLRPAGISLTLYFAYYLGGDARAQFHIMGPIIVMIMSGTVAFESLVLGEAAAEKVGYTPNRAYQIQSGLANAAMAVTALLVFALEWGPFAEATIVTAMLIFFALSALNHLASAVLGSNMKPVNLIRPAVALLLTGLLLPPMLSALKQ